MTSARFDPFALVRALVDHGVEFVVIGGIAAVAHGSDETLNPLDAPSGRTL